MISFLFFVCFISLPFSVSAFFFYSFQLSSFILHYSLFLSPRFFIRLFGPTISLVLPTDVSTHWQPVTWRRAVERHDTRSSAKVSGTCALSVRPCSGPPRVVTGGLNTHTCFNDRIVINALQSLQVFLSIETGSVVSRSGCVRVQQLSWYTDCVELRHNDVLRAVLVLPIRISQQISTKFSNTLHDIARIWFRTAWVPHKAHLTDSVATPDLREWHAASHTDAVD